MPRSSEGLAAPWSRSGGIVARTVAQPLQQFLHTEASSGIVLAVCAAVALVWANSPWDAAYADLWHTRLSIELGSLRLDEDLRHWVNDLAMALFFFVAGLEIKRELVHGQLRSPRDAALPIACAAGGMIVPALVYVALTAGDAEIARGWGIPMATDIAFSIGVLALLGRRVPASLKVFLLTLAIVDDIGAIIVIAVVYSAGVEVLWLAAGATAAALVVVLQRIGVRWLAPYVVLAAVIWLAMFESGVHATIAGVILGLLTPAHPLHHPADVQRVVATHLGADDLADVASEERDEAAFLHIGAVANEAVSPLARLEHRLHPWSSFAVLPLFALANAGVSLSGAGLDLGSGLTLGIVLGLVVGKPVGVLLAAVIATRVLGARLPVGADWSHIAGAGALAGIGFTVSLFVSGLAFDGQTGDQAKVAVLLASCIAAALGAGLLVARSRGEARAPSSGG